ncbi:TadE/TadG family type IV pilus assembly protein [Acidicapsa dinghuensis]|uniref:TadE/TadG family type IV pilus assembly protein n=1 Tax=Acidicapsa dinghuensis TaxID=2218256 RepID=A0ABW1ECQ2_9BACT
MDRYSRCKKSRLAKRFRQNELGATLVELALSSAIFLGMLTGVFEMCWAFNTYHYVDEIAREGTRYAIVRGSTSCTNTPSLTNCNATVAEIRSYLQGIPYPGVDGPDRMTVTVNYFTPSSATPTTWTACASGTCNAPGNLVKVQVTYSFPLNIAWVTKRNLNMTSSSSLVIAQ